MSESTVKEGVGAGPWGLELEGVGAGQIGHIQIS